MWSAQGLYVQQTDHVWNGCYKDIFESYYIIQTNQIEWQEQVFEQFDIWMSALITQNTKNSFTFQNVIEDSDHWQSRLDEVNLLITNSRIQKLIGVN